MDISVIIVSYNVRHYLEQCLHSVFAAAGGMDVEVFVVDNASSDGSVDFLRRKFPAGSYPQLHVLANSRNIGFGRANNQAVRRAKGEYVLFLNPDTLLTEQTLRDSLDFARAHPRMGGLGTMMLHSDGSFAYESRRGLPTPWTAFCKMCGLASLFPKSRLFGKYYMRYLDCRQPAEIEIISGAYMMVRRYVLEECGLFDEAFFMYGEDIDLSYRILKAGYTNYYIPSPILHYKGESTQKSSYRYVHVFYGAMLIFFKKHYRHCWIGLSIPIKVAILVRALLAIMAQQLQTVKKFLVPERGLYEGQLLYVGRQIGMMEKLAEQWGLDVVCIEADCHTMPVPSLPKEAQNGAYRYVIYDVADFEREYILQAFRDSTHTCSIGTFSPQARVLITAANVFELRPNLR